MPHPCRHILALCKELETEIFEITLCANHWLLETYVVQLISRMIIHLMDKSMKF